MIPCFFIFLGKPFQESHSGFFYCVLINLYASVTQLIYQNFHPYILPLIFLILFNYFSENFKKHHAISRTGKAFAEEQQEKSSISFLWESARGAFQEQTRRVCDAATANNARAESIRKRSAGYAMR